LTESIEKNESLFPQLIEILRSGSDVERGTAADVMKHVSKDRPEVVVPFIDELVSYVNDKAPRVKWGVPETIGNLAQNYPTDVEKAVPKLLMNTKDKSTVVRWCAAFALTEIVKHSPKIRRELRLTIEEIVRNENNNGVRNVYLKALRIMKK
jgi:HEAT repeat protein